MRKNANGTILLLILVALCTSCTTITVTKIDPTQESSSIQGKRIPLPRPYIQVTPQTDGSISADLVYLGDPNHTYAIHSSSFLADDMLEVTTDGGQVKTINWTGDSSAVMAQAATSGGAIGGSILTTSLQNEQKQKTDQQTAETSAAKAVNDAKLVVQQAQSDLSILIANKATDSDILKQKIALNDAVLKLQAAQDNLKQLQGGKNSLTAAADKPDSKGTYGPILFAVRDVLQVSGTEISPYVALEAVKQKFPLHQSTDIVKEGFQPAYPVKRPSPTSPPEIRVYPQGDLVVRPDKDGNKRISLQVSSPLVNLVWENIQFRTVDNIVVNKPYITLDSSTTIGIDLNQTPAGSYVLHLDWQTQKHDNPTEKDGGDNFNIKVIK